MSSPSQKRRLPPILVMALSIVPGLGQLLVGRRARGLMLLLGLPAQVALLLSAGLPALAFWLLPVWLWNLRDAYTAARGRTAPITFPLLLILLINGAAGWSITEIQPLTMLRGLPRMRPILAGLARPDLVERARETQRGTASLLIGSIPGGDGETGRRGDGETGRRGDLGDTERGPNGTSSPSPRLPVAQVSPSPRLPVSPSPRLPVVCLLPAGRTAAGASRSVVVTGIGFWPGVEGRIWLVGAGRQVLARIRTSGSGTLRVPVTIPPRPSGRYWIDVVLDRSLPRWQISEALARSSEAMVATVFMALMGTLFAVVVALPLSFFAARNLMGASVPTMAIYGATRTLLNLLRSVEVMIVALLMVTVVGTGPFAGVLALGIHGVGALGKLYSEAIEAIDPGPIEAVTATGATPLQVVMFGVLPQVAPQLVAFTVYRWDINVRMATVIGLVGGGGIGFLLLDTINLGRWPQAGTAIWLIAAVVSAMDAASAALRERLL